MAPVFNIELPPQSMGGRFRNTEILTVPNQQIVETEVYFGWSIPHKAMLGAFTAG